MSRLDMDMVRELDGWQCERGVVSVYLGFEPGDRGGAWRTELRNGLNGVLEGARNGDHGQSQAVRSTVARVAERFEDEVRPPPLAEVGFVEISAEPGRERWWQLGVPPPATAVHGGSQPLLAPLIALERHCQEIPVALLSAERVRLLRFAEGELDELDEWELTITSLDWRERKSRSSEDPAQAQGVSSSGRDQYDERLEHNRRRFLAETAERIAERIRARDGDQLLAFGAPNDLEQLREGLHPLGFPVATGGTEDLISVPTGELVERTSAAVAELLAERDRTRLEEALSRAAAGDRGAAGTRQVSEALEERRVEHLLFDLGIGPSAEELVREALEGGAGMTALDGEQAEPLASADGVAAILRY